MENSIIIIGFLPLLGKVVCGNETTRIQVKCSDKWIDIIQVQNIV